LNLTDCPEKSARRDLVLTSNALFLIGREKIKKGPEKGKFKEVIKRKLELENIGDITLSTLQVSDAITRL
jgi:myosin I